MKYYVITRFYDSGKTEGELLLESEYKGQQNESTSMYDQYVDTFPTFEKAEEFLKGLRFA